MPDGMTPGPQDTTGMGPFGPMSVPGAPPTAVASAIDQEGPPVTIQDAYDEMRASAVTQEDIQAAETFMMNAYLWHIGKGIPFDPTDPEQSAAYLNAILFEEEGGDGGVGRVQFPSEAEVDWATAALRREQAQTEAYQREVLRQQAGTQAFDRAKAKFDLLTVTDQLADARREAATDALIAALPYMVGPGQQYTPGFEPFGAGQQLGQMLGANVPPQQMPTAQLPLNELANPPLAAPPADIAAGLDPFLTAAGTSQI